MRLSRIRRRVLVTTLTIDVAAVTLLGLGAVIEERTSADEVLVRILAGCAVVGYLSWMLAVAAVVVAIRAGARERARLLLWVGLSINTVGSVIVAMVIPHPLPAALLTVAGLAVGGLVLTLVYLGAIGRPVASGQHT